MLASVTGSGDTLGGLLSSEATCNSHSNCLDQVYLIPGKTRTRGPCLVPTVVFLIRIPSLPGLFQCHVELGKEVEQAAHVAWRQRSQSALFPCPCRSRAGLGMTGCWWWRRLRREGLCDLYFVTWSHVGFLFQFEKNDCF